MPVPPLLRSSAEYSRKSRSDGRKKFSMPDEGSWEEPMSDPCSQL